MSSVSDFTKGKIGIMILKFYFPLFATNMLQQLYNFTDTAIVGNGLGDNALAAVGNMGTLNFLIIGFSLGLAIGFSVNIAQDFGAKNFEKLRHDMAGAISLAIIIMVILTILSNLFLKDALILLRTDPLIMRDSLLYGHIIFGGLFAAIAYNLSAAILRAFGDSRTPLKAIVISSVLNIGLDMFFIFVLHTGVEGAAIATVGSQVISALICIRGISRLPFVRLKAKDFKNDTVIYLSLLKNGVPMAIMNSITAVGCMAVQFFVNGYGVIYTAAYSTCSKYINLFMQPACTAGHAMSAYTSQNYGARKYDRIGRGLGVCIGIAFVSYFVLGTIMYVFAENLADVFLENPLSIGLAVQFFHITAFTIIAVDCLFVFRSSVQAMGYPLIPMISGIFEMLLRVLVIAVFSAGIGFRATAIAETSAWIGALILNLVAFLVILRGKVKDANEIKHFQIAAS